MNTKTLYSFLHALAARALASKIQCSSRFYYTILGRHFECWPCEWNVSIDAEDNCVMWAAKYKVPKRTTPGDMTRYGGVFPPPCITGNGQIAIRCHMVDAFASILPAKYAKKGQCAAAMVICIQYSASGCFTGNFFKLMKKHWRPSCESRTREKALLFSKGKNRVHAKIHMP